MGTGSWNGSAGVFVNRAVSVINVHELLEIVTRKCNF